MIEIVQKLEQQVAESSDEKEKIAPMLGLIGYYFSQDVHKALATANEVYLLAKRVGSETQVARAVLGRGNCLYVLGRHKEALALLREAQEKLHQLGLAYFESTAWINIGGIYTEWGDHPHALECRLRSLKLARESGHKRNEQTALTNLISAYYVSKDIERALEYCAELQECSRRNEIPEGNVSALVYLGIIYLHSLNQPERAKEFFLQGVQEFQSGMYENSRVMALENLGDIYMRLEQFEEAEETLQHSLSIAQRVGVRQMEIKPLLLLGKLYASKGDYTAALESISMAQAIAEELSMKEFRYAVHSEYASCYKRMGNYEKALEHHELFHSIKEEVFDEESRKKMNNLTVLHDVEKAQSAKDLAEKEREITHLKNVELSSALAEVQALNERLERLNKEKNEVIGVVAHDLKSPLSGMRMVASLVKSHHKKMPEAEVIEQLGGIEGTADRMLTIVNNLLDVHAIESGSYYDTEERVDVREVIGALVEEYRPVAGQKGIEVVAVIPDIEVCITGSRDGLQQAIENVLSNAIKFSSRGKRVEVRLRIEEGTVVVEVADRGPGMSKRDQSKLFKKFSRLTARPTGDESSTGLGLWIAKKAVDALGGQIRCESKLRRGTTFIVELPVLQ